MSGGAHHSSRSVQMQGSFSRVCTQATSRLTAAYQGEAGCVLARQSWQVALRKAALQFWYCYKPGREPVQCHCLGNEETFFLCFELGFLRGPVRLGSSLLRISRLWLSLQRQEAAPHSGKQLVANRRIKAIFIPFMFSHLSPPDKFRLYPCYHRTGVLQGWA